MDMIISLTKEDFSLKQGKTGLLLCHNIPNISLVLFSRANCVHCEDLKPIFQKLPSKFNFCRFAMVNFSLGDNIQIAKMSMQSVVPINAVPLLMIYNNGRPLMIYEGPRVAQAIVQFLEDVYARYHIQESFMGNTQKQNIADNDFLVYKNRQMMPYNLLLGDDKKNCYQQSNNQSCPVGDAITDFMTTREQNAKIQQALQTRRFN